jgi:hypothetical protein
MVFFKSITNVFFVELFLMDINRSSLGGLTPCVIYPVSFFSVSKFSLQDGNSSKLAFLILSLALLTEGALSETFMVCEILELSSINCQCVRQVIVPIMPFFECNSLQLMFAEYYRQS